MTKYNKTYQIVEKSGDVIYECVTAPEANRVFDLIRFLKPDVEISLNIVLRKA